MKNPYVIGIVLAVVLLAALAFTRMNGPSHAEPAQDLDTGNVVEQLSTNDNQEDPMQEDTTTSTGADDSANDTVAEAPAPADVPAEEPAQQAETTTVVLKTNMGDISIELLTGAMPITAGNFLKLARDDYYDGVKFHRIISGFMIQGGDPLTKDDSMQNRWGTGGPGYTIQDEFGPGYSNSRGTISMANAGPNTGGSQFFINTVDNTFLDGKHPVFGRVTAGLDVVDAIAQVETAPGDRPLSPVIIEDIVIQ
jgi:peptidylprolyl isomerase